MEHQDKSIDISEVQFSPTIRLFDPNGRVFFWKGTVYRGIYPHRVDFINGLFENSVKNELMDQGLISGTYKTNLEMEGFGMILRHDRLKVQIRSNEWSVSTFIQAAKTYLDLYCALHKHGLSLNDGHHNNFSMTRGGRVLWHDIGSIVEPRTDSFQGLNEYITYFYNPLILYRSIGDFKVIRRLGMNLTQEEFYRFQYPRLMRIMDLGASSNNRSFSKLSKLLFLLFTNRYIQSTGLIGVMNEVRGLIRKTTPSRQVQVLIDFLRENINDVKVRAVNTNWSDYQHVTHLNDWSLPNGKRQEQLQRLIAEIKPQTLLDLGSNNGRFSHLIRQYTDSIISADYDEMAVAGHVRLLLEQGEDFSVYPAILDATKMDQSQVQRFRSHTVLALALTHHLRLGQGYPFDFIAKTLSSLTERVLITEFMPNGLGVMRTDPDPLPEDYTLENFLKSFMPFFDSINLVDYVIEENQSPRTMVICKKQKA